MTLAEALAGKEIPDELKDTLVLIAVPYHSFDGDVREGKLVIHRDLAHEVQHIFKILCEKQFPIQSITPIVAYDWDDDASMAANNSSAFNYRLIRHTDRLSNHSYGRAIDINPYQNPYLQRDGKTVPPGAHYDVRNKGTVTPEIAEIFISRGWQWGGNWRERKDWQHFEKPPADV